MTDCFGFQTRVLPGCATVYTSDPLLSTGWVSRNTTTPGGSQSYKGYIHEEQGDAEICSVLCIYRMGQGGGAVAAVQTTAKHDPVGRYEEGLRPPFCACRYYIFKALSVSVLLVSCL